MYGPSDMYGDMDIEDVDEFAGLQPNDEREIRPTGRFQRNEVRNFHEDFEHELEAAEEMEHYRDLTEEEQDEFDDEAYDQVLQDLNEGKL